MRRRWRYRARQVSLVALLNSILQEREVGELPMTKLLRIPNEARFVRAFALAIDPGDTLSLLLEIGALGSRDLSLVRRTREALDPAYDRASDLKDWDQTHTISVLREALAQSDSAAYLAYCVRDNQRAGHTATEYAEALVVVGCAADTLTLRRRPWEIEPDDLSLPEWRRRVWKLLFAMPGNALPKPSTSQAPADPDCVCSESGSPKALAGDHTSWCTAWCDGGGP
jgi:hypothetical protein